MASDGERKKKKEIVCRREVVGTPNKRNIEERGRLRRMWKQE